jgi:glycosyltransferase involved in cell wall biosynthesis
MRIVFVSWRDLDHPSAGGSEVYVDEIARRLVAADHDVLLVAGRPVGHRDYPTVSSGGTYTQYLGAPVQYLKVRRPVDLIVDVSNGIPFFSPLWRRGPRVMVVHHVHRQQWAQYFPAPVAWAGDLVERRAVPVLYRRTPVIAVSTSTREDLLALGFSPDAITVVENGIDPVLLDVVPRPAPDPRFVALGRLAPNKRLDLLLEMWARVRPHTGGQLIVVGDGPERDRLVRQAPAGVTFTGRVSETAKRDLLGSSWLLVHAAAREGWGIAVMEAAAAGVPALAFDGPGLRDAIVDGVTGELARSPDDLCLRWIDLAAAAPRRAALGAAAARRARDYTWDATTARFLDVARQAMKGPPGRAEREAA